MIKKDQWIKFEFDRSKYEGKVFRVEKNFFFIIFPSGYLFSFEKKKCKNIVFYEKNEPIILKKDNIPKGKKLPKILILNTGGTISSVQNFSKGGVSTDELNFSYFLYNFLKNKKINVLFKEKYIFNILSESLNFSYLNILMKEIKIALLSKEFQGIIITHGTDTLAYSSALCSFLFDQYSDIPIFFVGAQKSIDRPNTDALFNLYAALRFILEIKEPYTFVSMYGDYIKEIIFIHRGFEVKKIHTSRRDSFESIGNSPYAYFQNNRFFFKKKFVLKKKSLNESTLINFSKDLNVIYFHPYLLEKEYNKFLKKKGVLLIGSGIGGVPEKFLPFVSEKNIFFSTTKCIKGPVNLNIYSSGKGMLEKKIIPSSCPTIESSFMKFSIALARYSSFLDIQKFLISNQIGENIRKDI